MRTFFAIEFEDEVKDYLYSVQQEIKKFCDGGNYSHKENFHLTLRFIGEQNLDQINKLKTALHEAAAGFSGFELKLDKIGRFNKGNKKIIWMGVNKSSELQKLYGKLEEVLEKYGYASEERGYNPHITLVRETRLEDGSADSLNIANEKLSIKVRSISLMESARINNKLTYTAMEKAALRSE